jgi:hypothetical protein
MMFSSKSVTWGVTLLLVLAGSASTAGTTVIDTGSIAQAHPTTMTDTIQTPLPSGSPAASKIASSLQRVVQRMQQDGVTAANVTARHAERYTTPLVHVDSEGRVHTAILVTTFDAQVELVLTAHQVSIDRADAQARLVQAWIPFDRLETVAALPFVRYLRPPSYASRR